MDLHSKWLLASYGWLGYNLLVFFIEKQAADRKQKAFNYKLFIEGHWDNWLVTAFFAAPVVYYGPDIHATIMDILHAMGIAWEIKWNDIFYAGPGAFVEILYWGYLYGTDWIKGKRKNLKEPPQE